MVAKSIQTDEIKRYLRQCGYQDDCLRASYAYFAGNQEHTIDLAGFARKTFNSENACIGLTNAVNLSEDQIKAHVLSYRELGAPVILVNREKEFQFWNYRQNDAVFNETVKYTHAEKFFGRYQDQFKPDQILRAKMIGRSNRNYHQLSFVDYGLMPLIEKKEGEYLCGVIKRIIDNLSKVGRINQESDTGATWLTQAAFWLMGAKILKDKQVPSFRVLDIADIETLINKVKRHYNAETPLDLSGEGKRRALEKVAEEIVKPISSLAHITINSLSYVYENALVTPATRKALGTHATPSWLVNYIVWKMPDWIEAIPENDRRILEPTCGHAPFLTIGAKLLSLLYTGPEDKRHDYLKNHLIGIEADPFALEIARLSLTLADIPNQNGWKVCPGDIYQGEALSEAAKNTTILLCNPPFQNFTPDEKKKYEYPDTGNKAAEVLSRTLPFMPENSVFGVVLPQGFLHKKSLLKLRKYILDHCELREICNLPDNTFEHAEHVSTVLFGRKIKGGTNLLGQRTKVSYLTVSKKGLKHFKETLDTPEENISQSDFYKTKDYNFRKPELHEIWDYCQSDLILGYICDVGQGFVYKGRDLPEGAITSKNQSFLGGAKGFAFYDKNLSLTELPPVTFLNLSPEVIRRPHWGVDIGKPQVLLNYSRVSRDPWRLKAWIDNCGHPVTSNFLVIRPKNLNEWSLESLWALLNSPFANAYVYCHSMERANTTGVIRAIPVPKLNNTKRTNIDELVSKYFSINNSLKSNLIASSLLEEAKRVLLSIDAEVLKLYDLPPRLEKQLLDRFAGTQRKGVNFRFDRYYEEGFDAYIPLHMYISTEFQNSSVENVKKWIENNRTPEVIEAFKTATKIKK